MKSVFSLLLVGLLIAVPLCAKKQRPAGLPRKIATGVVNGSKSKLCLPDLRQEHKRDMKQLKKQYHLRSIDIVASPDDYWYYSIEGQKYCYGAIDQFGRVIVPPIFERCHYCPVLNVGTEEFSIDEKNGSGDTFRVYHPYVQGSFLAVNANDAYVFTLGINGESLILPSRDNTYYHGLIISGVASDEMGYSNNNGTLMFGTKTHDKAVTLLMSDGKQISGSDLAALYIAECHDGAQPVYTFQSDEDGIMRVGGLLVNHPDNYVPEIFGSLEYHYEDSLWWVSPNGEENAMPYFSGLHDGIRYHDDGERMYYLHDYEGCLDFYLQHLTDTAYIDHHPWVAFFAAAAYFRQGEQHYKVFNDAMSAFENVPTGRYALYYDKRHHMQGWPKSDLAGWQQARSLLDRYNKARGGHLYSESAERMRKDIVQYTNFYRNNSRRYDTALATLDSRIAEQKEKERRAAEEQAAQEAAMQQMIGGFVENVVGSVLVT